MLAVSVIGALSSYIGGMVLLVALVLLWCFRWRP